MLQTIADDIWAKPCLAYHVQPALTPETQSALANLQKGIVENWPSPLHIGPPTGLHVTIYALVPVKADFDKEGYWAGIERQVRDLVGETCREHPPIVLRFHRLKVTDTAIIAVAREETGLIERIRQRIVEQIPPPPGRRPLLYDLIHTTLARYPTSISAPQALVDGIEALPVSVTASVGRIRVIRETLFPCQAVDEIASFPLGAAT